MILKREFVINKKILKMFLTLALKWMGSLGGHCGRNSQNKGAAGLKNGLVIIYE